MLEQFEQSLEHLDEAGITSIEVLQSVIEEIQAIGIAQFHLMRDRGCVIGVLLAFNVRVQISSLVPSPSFLLLLFGKIAQVTT